MNASGGGEVSGGLRLRERVGPGVSGEVGPSTVDLALRLVDVLANASASLPLKTLASLLGATKPTVYRHLRTLVRHGFARQDPTTGHYDVGIKLMVLGEASRHRFGVVRAARDELMALRDATGQAATICSLVDGEVVVVELIQGRSVIEFGTRPGTRLSLHASAHGKIWLAFGPADLERGLAGESLRAWTPQTVVDADRLRGEIDRVRASGWSTAPNEVVLGVNAIAAPVFDHRQALAGSIAIVGATQFIPEEPDPEQVRQLIEAARRVSASLGFRN